MPEPATEKSFVVRPLTTLSYDIGDFGIDLDHLAMSDLDVARLGRSAREARLTDLIAESTNILDIAEEHLIRRQKRTVVATVALCSGGNDSMTLTTMFHRAGRLTHAAHANTGIGVEQTRQFVRDTTAAWGLPLIERKAAREEDSYRSHVLAFGFPGPQLHWKMFTRLKERALEQVRNELVTNPYRERAVFIAGRRRTESGRRANIPELQRRGSVVWVSPLVNWTKVDMNTYRLVDGNVPRNEVSDLIHMSGECLCGSFAHAGERAEVSEWFPRAFDGVAEMEAILAAYPADYVPAGARKPIPDYAKTWGWGADPEVLALSRQKPSKSGPLCSSCDSRFSLDAAAHPTVAVA